jgi:hypothetical protein
MDSTPLPVLVQLGWPIVVGLALFALTRLRSPLEGRVKSLEDAGFNIGYRDRLTDRLARIETLLNIVRENQKDTLDAMVESLADVAHSDETPDLDYYFDKIKAVKFRNLTATDLRNFIQLLDKYIADPKFAEKRSTYATIRGAAISHLRAQHREKRLNAFTQLR